MRLMHLSRLALVGAVLFLVGCQSAFDASEQKAQRGTLAELAEQEANINITPISLTKAQRSEKLAKLYQSILTLEPNKEVRAQVTYRLVQLDSQAYDNFDDEQSISSQGNSSKNSNSKNAANNITPEQSLSALVLSYQALLKDFPDREDNEHVRYQLAKALDLQGKLDQSLVQIELLISQYPQSQYIAELQFRRGDIYYNLQHYRKALSAYQAVLNAKNNDTYYINSLYMSAWVLFKLNRLPEADKQFIAVLEQLISQEKVQHYEDDFSFDKLNSRYQSLLKDTQRVLSISLSQQQQSASLVSLLTHQQGNDAIKHLYLYRHILFKNLADFLIENDLQYDAQLTYQAYITLAPNSLWASRFSLNLLALYQQQGKYSAVRQLKIQYVHRYGMNSVFWQQAIIAPPSSMINERVLTQEVLPNLLSFSYQHSRRLYANAQTLELGIERQQAFADVANWLNTYLDMAELPQSQALIDKLPLSEGLLSDKLLYADARFEAKQYQQALSSYQQIAYGFRLGHKSRLDHKNKLEHKDDILQREAAYATTLTVRKMLAQLSVSPNDKAQLEKQQKLIVMRDQFDRDFIRYYPKDERALSLATQAAQYAFNMADYKTMDFYSHFILQSYGVISTIKTPNATIYTAKASQERVKRDELSTQALKQVQIASQLQANSLYQQLKYQAAEQSYVLALMYVEKNTSSTKTMRDLLASSIYFQAQETKDRSPLIAVEHLLRLGVIVPESSYRVTAEFDAANILLAQGVWQQAADVLLNLQIRYPKHEYSVSIPAKLAKSYENLGQWHLAAAQLLILAQGQGSTELKREAQYNAAEHYLKAGNLPKAITSFRTYAHNYPEPFDVAQEVRYKMSEFYQQTKEPNKQYYWYRKLISFHDKKLIEQKGNVNLGSANGRSTYLVSVAALGLGEAHQQTFTRTKLTLPLNKSLKRKQKAMKSAIHYYQKLLSYQRAEFVPHGTFNLAQMYAQLAEDVMSSQRPKDLDELALEEYELILEEIAYPFEEKAIEIHVSNAERAWQNIFDAWVENSFAVLAELEPAQYNKKERKIYAVHAIY